MGLFRKESSTHFVRDEAGRVVDVQHKNGNGAGDGWKSSRQLTKEYYGKHPTRLQRIREESKQRRVEERSIRNEAFQKARRGEIRKQAADRGRMSARPITSSYQQMQPGRRNANPFGSVFDLGLKPMSSRGNVKTVTHKKKSGGKKKRKNTMHKKDGLGGFDMLGNNWGL